MVFRIISFGKIILCLFIITSSCKKDAELIWFPENFDISDPAFQKIKDLEDRRDDAKIIEYLETGNPREKYWAIQAISSTQDSNSINLILKYLKEPQKTEVKKRLAYSLGQIRIRKAPGKEIQNVIESNQDPLVKHLLLEALGKIGGKEDLSYLAKFQTMGDSLLQLGKALGLYRMGLRDLISPSSIKWMIHGLDKDNFYLVRILCSNFLARIRPSDIMDNQERLIESMKNDEIAEVRMNIATSLGAGSGNSTRNALLETASKDPDFRVRVNSLSSLKLGMHKIDTATIKGTCGLSTLNERIANAEWIADMAEANDLSEILRAEEECQDWKVKGLLFKAALRVSSPSNKRALVQRLKKRIERSINDYEVALLLSFLLDYPFEHEFVFGFARDPSLGMVINSGAMYTLTAMVTHEEFESKFKSRNEEPPYPSFAQYFKYGVLSGDATLIGYGSRAFRNQEIPWTNYLQDFLFLETAKGNLDLPNESETLIEIDKTLAVLKGEDYEYPEIVYTHPPVWNEIESNFKYKKARVNTNKGSFEIFFYWDLAPLTVSNFVSLSQSGFYDGIRFHRVENNFVVQGGCPRGDGWGGPGYSIRSEFAAQYFVGSVGMASAGKDTEGCQWFVSHYPTSHLDGKYSCFAGVTTGMDVVYDLAVGDTILGISLEGE